MESRWVERALECWSLEFYLFENGQAIPDRIGKHGVNAWHDSDTASFLQGQSEMKANGIQNSRIIDTRVGIESVSGKVGLWIGLGGILRAKTQSFSGAAGRIAGNSWSASSASAPSASWSITVGFLARSS
jgi:hypothetical protein